MTLSDFAKEAVVQAKYQPKMDPVTGAITTFCNVFVAACARSVGCEELNEFTANQMVCQMEEVKTWVEVSAYAAASAAENGYLVVAGIKTGDLTKHGHVCIVVPGGTAWSKNFNQDMPFVANVGKTNFHKRLASYAFTTEIQPRYFMWVGEAARRILS